MQFRIKAWMSLEIVAIDPGSGYAGGEIGEHVSFPADSEIDVGQVEFDESHPERAGTALAGWIEGIDAPDHVKLAIVHNFLNELPDYVGYAKDEVFAESEVTC